MIPSMSNSPHLVPQHCLQLATLHVRRRLGQRHDRRAPRRDQEDAHNASERRQRQHGRGRILDDAKLLLLDRAWRVVSPKELTFLYEAYKGRVWYWEVLETTRCLLLTAVVSVVGFGSTGQLVFGILVAIIYVKLYGYFQPYVQNELDIVQAHRDDRLPGDAWARALDAHLVVANLSTVIAAIVVYFHWHELDGRLVRRLRGRGEGPADNNKSDEEEAAAAPTALIGHASARRVHVSDDDENRALPLTYPRPIKRTRRGGPDEEEESATHHHVLLPPPLHVTRKDGT